MHVSVSAEVSSEVEDAIHELETILSDFDGDWIGTIQSYELDGDFPDRPFTQKMLFRIDGEDILVGTENEDGKRYKMPYKWEVVRNKTQLLIYTQAAKDAWSESFVFTLTLLDIDEINLLWSRAVSNFHKSPEDPNARGFFQGKSTLKREG